MSSFIDNAMWLKFILSVSCWNCVRRSRLFNQANWILGSSNWKSSDLAHFCSKSKLTYLRSTVPREERLGGSLWARSQSWELKLSSLHELHPVR